VLYVKVKISINHFSNLSTTESLFSYHDCAKTKPILKFGLCPGKVRNRKDNLIVQQSLKFF